MRIRHRLKLDEPNDFDLATQDAVLKVWDQISQATFLALVVISLDRADGRRHRRHGDHDDLGHRADARDRRPQGARRAPPRDPLAVPDRGRLPHLRRRPARHPLRQLRSACSSTGSRASRSRCRGGPSPSASASRPASASSSACSRRSKRRGWIRSKRCGTSRARFPLICFRSASQHSVCIFSARRGPSPGESQDPEPPCVASASLRSAPLVSSPLPLGSAFCASDRRSC